MDTVVQLRAVAKTFGNRVALRGLDLDIAAGSVTVLVGPNGAGKTTALRLITGALTPESGRVVVFGVDPGGPSGAEVRRRCGVVAANPALYDRLSGRDNLRYSARLYGADEDRIPGAAARFGIDDALDVRVGGYSTGMKTRLALARAVLHDPPLLLLDEPTSGLDPESAAAVLELIDSLGASGTAVVMCTHLLAEADGLADRVVVIDAGRVLEAGSPDELVRRYWPLPAVELHAGAGRMKVELDGIDEVPDLVRLLVGAGVAVGAVIPHEPSLDDLYRMVRHESRL